MSVLFRKRRMFTLVELTAVLMILILITGIAVSSLPRMSFFSSLQHIAAGLQAGCADLRQTVSFSNKCAGITFDPEERTFSCGERIIPILEDVKIIMNGEDITTGHEKKEVFRLYPDGSGNGRKISLVHENGQINLFLSPLTGRLVVKNEKD